MSNQEPTPTSEQAALFSLPQAKAEQRRARRGREHPPSWFTSSLLTLPCLACRERDEGLAMSVSSAMSSFLLCCFYPTGGHRHHGHRTGAYYYSSHPTSSNTLYYHDGGLAGAGRRMGRSKPLSLQVSLLCFFLYLALLSASLPLCSVRSQSQYDR